MGEAGQGGESASTHTRPLALILTLKAGIAPGLLFGKQVQRGLVSAPVAHRGLRWFHSVSFSFSMCFSEGTRVPGFHSRMSGGARAGFSLF